MDGARTEAEAEENASCVSFSGSSIHLSDPHPFLSNKWPNVVGRKGKKNLRVANGFPHRGPPQHRGSNSQMSGPEKQKEEKKKKKRRQQGCVDARRNVSSGGNVSDSACLTRMNQDSVGWWTELGCAPKTSFFQDIPQQTHRRVFAADLQHAAQEAEPNERDPRAEIVLAGAHHMAPSAGGLDRNSC